MHVHSQKCIQQTLQATAQGSHPCDHSRTLTGWQPDGWMCCSAWKSSRYTLLKMESIPDLHMIVHTNLDTLISLHWIYMSIWIHLDTGYGRRSIFKIDVDRLLKEFVTSSWPVQQLKRALVEPHFTKDQTLQKPGCDPICRVFDITYENHVKIMRNRCIIKVMYMMYAYWICMHMSPMTCNTW